MGWIWNSGLSGMEREPHWILKGLSAALLALIPWAILGFILNILIPLVGLTVCCESLSPTYYSFAYWLPLAVALVTGLIVLLAWARDRASTKTKSELAKESVKGAVFVLALWLSFMAYTGRLI